MTKSLREFTEADVHLVKNMPLWRQRGAVPAMRVDGPFMVLTADGDVLCDDGYLTFDRYGRPWPLGKAEFERTYEPFGND